jgi:hypothetical protein
MYCKNPTLEVTKKSQIQFSLDLVFGFLKYFDKHNNNGNSIKTKIIFEIEKLQEGYRFSDKIDKKILKDIILSADFIAGGKEYAPEIYIQNESIGLVDRGVEIRNSPNIILPIIILLHCFSLIIDSERH